MKKRFLSLLLMLCMLTALMPITVGAESIQYVVAGSYSLFGSSWDFTSDSGHIMNEKNGKYELLLSPAEACGTVLLKVAKLTNGVVASNSDYYGDASGNNIEINVSGSGEILIVFDPSTHEITVSGDNVTMINGLQIDSMRTVGSGNGNWLNGVSWDPADDANLMTETSSGIYEITYTGIAVASDYEFKFAANGSWTDIWGGSINSEDAVYNGNNIIFDVKQDNSTVKMVFDFTNFDYATKTGAIYKLYVNNVQINGSQTTEKNITLGTSALKGGQVSNVYFGNYQQSSLGNTEPTEGTMGIDWIQSTTAVNNEQGAYYKKEPIKWRVLSKDGSKLFLLSDKNLDVVQYHTDNESVTWATSTIRSWLNGYGASSNTGGGEEVSGDNFIDSAFSDSEQQAIVETNVVNNDNPTYNTEGGNNTTDKVFLLSIEEAQNTSYFEDDDSRKAVNTAYVCGGGKNGTSDMWGIGAADYWWLRSPGFDADLAASVNHNGGVLDDGNYVDNCSYAVRPAFNLNLSSVLFTSAALEGKSVAVGTLSANVENTDNEYKLTMKDSTRSGFTAKATAVSGKVLTVSYTNAKAGENEYISAIIVNADGNVTHYGRLANVTSESGTASLDMTGITLASTDRLYIFNEQINGDYKTDFASELKEIAIKTNITLTKDKVSAYLVGNSATLIVASYKDKALRDVKTITVTSNIYENTLAEIRLDANGADSIKAFLWTDMENLTPLCEEQEVILNQSAS